MPSHDGCYLYFFFNDTAPTEIYTLSLHDALPIYEPSVGASPVDPPLRVQRRQAGEEREADLEPGMARAAEGPEGVPGDRKSTRLNSSHANISYAVFCLKKKNSSHANISSSTSRST